MIPSEASFFPLRCVNDLRLTKKLAASRERVFFALGLIPTRSRVGLVRRDVVGSSRR